MGDDRPGSRRRIGWRLVTVLAFTGLAAGMSGDVPALVERLRPGAVYAVGAAEPAGAAEAVEPLPAPTSTTTAVPQPARWSLLAGGDVLMDRSEPAGRDPFAQLDPHLSQADLALVNVEMAVSDGGTAQAGKAFTFRAPPSAAATMAAAGIDVGALGNNHAADFGPGALVETVDHLRAAGVEPVGAGAHRDAAFAPASFTIGSDGETPVRVAVLSASGVVPPGFAASNDRPGVASAYERDRLLGAVRAAKATHDVVVVAVHWGIERASCPAAVQVELGDALVEAGASVVVGSHPHVLQPVVERGGGLVAYSLGNFAWHSRTGAQGETGVLEVRFEGSRLDGFSFHPHRLDANGDPVPADGPTATRIEAAVTNDVCA